MPAPRPPDLDGLRVLVVEDSFLIADLITEELQDAGCSVVGPASRVKEGLALANAEPLDGALLDVNLAGEFCFPIAEALAAKGVPFVFLTGYGDAGLPSAFRQMPRLEKPFDTGELMKLVGGNFTKAS
jgi:DNA-binding response OmpR family regulator